MPISKKTTILRHKRELWLFYYTMIMSFHVFFARYSSIPDVEGRHLLYQDRNRFCLAYIPLLHGELSLYV